MTALKKYQRLECPGIWRETPETEGREVIVSFREASLILSDPATEFAVSHWSLPAVERVNPGKMPAVFSPGKNDPETLEIDDKYMLAALDTVRGALEAARPRPGRLRHWALAGATALVLSGFFWMPGALVSHAIAVAPEATRVRLGEMALTEMVHLTGAPCADPFGRRAAANLSTRIFRAEPVQIIVVPQGLTRPIHLPNRQILVPRNLVEQQDNPAPLAGYAIAERARAAAVDPLRPLLEHAGVAATLRLLTTGALPQSALDGYAEALVTAAPTEVSDADLLPRFTEAEVPSTPYARAVDPTGATVRGLIDRDPFASQPAPPILPDEDWIGLSTICQS